MFPPEWPHWFLYWLGFIVASLGLIALAGVAIHYCIDTFRVGKVLMAFFYWQVKDRGQCRTMLEEWADPDKQFRRERARLHIELLDYQHAELDLREVATTALSRGGDGSHENPLWSEVSPRVDTQKLARLILESIGPNPHAKDRDER
jgi:hypothetical protein